MRSYALQCKATVFLNGLSAKAYTLIDTSASLNFESKEFVMANGFYKDYKTALKLAIRVANEQRISMIKYFVLQFFILMGTSSLIYNLEIFLTLKVRILY